MADIITSVPVDTFLQSTTTANMRTNIGLGSVEDTAVSTWGGSTTINTVGTISAGTVNVGRITGTLPVSAGGTGQSTTTDGQLLIGNSSTTRFSLGTLSAGPNINIVNGNGTIGIQLTGMDALIAQGASGTGKVFYFNATSASDIAGYNIAMSTPSPNAESTIITNNTGTSWTSAGAFLTQPGEPGVIVIPAGQADRNIYVKVNNGVAHLKFDMYKYSGGVFTLFRSNTSDNFDSTVPFHLLTTLIDPTSYTVSLSDRLMFKISTARVSGPSTVTTTLYFEGTEHASHVHTTISDSSPVLAALSRAATPSGANLMLVSNAAGSFGYSDRIVPPTSGASYRSKFGILNNEDFFYQSGLSAVPVMEQRNAVFVDASSDVVIRCPGHAKEMDRFFIVISGSSATVCNITWQYSQGYDGDNYYWLETDTSPPFPTTISPGQILTIEAYFMFGVWRLASVRGNPPRQVVSMAANYSTVQYDVGRTIYHPVGGSGGYTWTIMRDAYINYPIGSEICFVNDAVSTTVSISAQDTLVWAGSPSTGVRTLSGLGKAKATKVAATRWMLEGTNIL